MGVKRFTRRPLRLVMLCGAVALAMASAVGGATANELAVNEDDLLITWNPLRFSMGGQAMNCPIILHGSFHSTTMDKSSGSLDGHITQVSIIAASCTSANPTVLVESLPWHFQYGSFEGELPEIANVAFRIVGIRAAFDPTGPLPACLWGTDATDPLVGIAELDESGNGTVTGFRADETSTVDLGGSFLCEIAGTLRFSGFGSMRAGDDTNPVVITLV